MKLNDDDGDKEEKRGIRVVLIRNTTNIRDLRKLPYKSY